MRRRLLVLTALAALGGGYYFYTLMARTETPPQVTTAAVSSGNIVERVEATGTLQATRTVNVGSQVSGVVSELLVDFNSIVTKNQVIAKLDPSLLQVQVDLNNATVERQRGEIANQEQQLENDRRTLDRTQTMFDKGLVARQALDAAELQVQVRQTQVDAARKSLLTVEANLSQAKLNLGYTIIRSPVDGVVVNRLVDTGQTVQSSMNVAQFFTVAADLRSLRLQAGVDEAEIGKIRPGMPVEFTVDAYPGETFHGTVENVTLNAQTANNVVTYPVWIVAPNAQLKLRPSMTATARIIVAEVDDVVRIPSAATRFRPTTQTYAALGIAAPAAEASATRAPRTAPSTQPAQTKTSVSARPLAPITAERIDELFAAATRPNTSATVWTWDNAASTLQSKRVTLGLNDGQFIQLIEGDLKPGEKLVTAVALPRETGQAAQSLFAQPGPGGFPGGGRGGF
jgi:HlyD family secretion protein